MPRKIDHTEEFYDSLSKITGIDPFLLKEYGENNAIINVIERPDVLKVSEQQKERLQGLNRMLSLYSLFKEQTQEITLDSPKDIQSYFEGLLKLKKDREVVMVAYLDSKNKIIETQIIAVGGIGRVFVEVRDILEAALANKCTSICMAHNHPSGDPTPSKEDIDLTKRVVNIFLPIGIHVLDHVIVGDRRAVSLRGDKYVNFENITGIAEYPVEKKLSAKRTNVPSLATDLESVMEESYETFFKAYISVETGIEKESVLDKTFQWFTEQENESLLNAKIIKQVQKYYSMENTFYIVSDQGEKEAYLLFAKEIMTEDIRVYTKKEIESLPLNNKEIKKVILALKRGDSFSEIKSYFPNAQIKKHNPVECSFEEDWRKEKEDFFKESQMEMEIQVDY